MSVSILLWETSAAQVHIIENEDESWNSYRLERAFEELKLTFNEYQAAQSLYQDDMISQFEFERKQSSYRLALAEYELALRRAQGGRYHTLITEARKYVDDSGNRNVRIRFRVVARDPNDMSRSEGAAGMLEDNSPPQGKPLQGFMSLRNGDVIVGQPYERAFLCRGDGVATELTFSLLEDFDNVTVAINWGDRSEEKTILLQHGTISKRVRISCPLFSQEVALGSGAVFPMNVEHPGGPARTFTLNIEGLPSNVEHFFSDPATGARLSLLRLSATNVQQDVDLNVQLPERAGEAITVDEIIRFSVTVAEQRESGADTGGEDPVVDGVVDLELLPRGVGRLVLTIDDLYVETLAGESMCLSGRLENAGTRALSNVKSVVSAPRGWLGGMEPANLTAIVASDGRPVSIELTSDSKAPVGDYEVLVHAEGYLGSSLIRSEEKRIRVHVGSNARFITSSIVIVGLLILLVTIGLVGAKVVRREA